MERRTILKNKIKDLFRFLCILVLIVIFISACIALVWNVMGNQREKAAMKALIKEKEASNNTAILEPMKELALLPEYASLYKKNNDMIGWLSIADTNIDYPVMQTPDDEEYYLHRGFDKQESDNGCLIMDTDSVVGSGTAGYEYQNGTRPSTNLIIHGHTMKSGQMFGQLKLYEEEEYAEEHSVICFDSLYEHREYKVIAVFYSQVYRKSENVFKYYKFFQADTKEEFEDWYGNIKAMSLYETGVEAKFGDEFITLSCCAYHVENGRFVVVGKRVS